MAYTVQVRTGEWNEFHGIWVLVAADLLGGGDQVELTVHPGPLRLRVRGQNAGVEMRADPPDTRDFADIEGDPL